MPNAHQHVRFRIYPRSGSRLYCEVNIFRDRAEMTAYLQATRGAKQAEELSDAVALATGIEQYRVPTGGRPRKTGCFAEILCHLGRLDTQIVVHETTHAALRWAARVGVDLRHREGDHFNCSDDEERFCYALDRMVVQFNDQLHRRKLWTKTK